MNTKVYDRIPDYAREIRTKVFIEEQGFQNEYDEIDEVAKHIVMFDQNDIPVATCRVFFDQNMNSHILGRLAVIKEYRGQNIGSKMISAAEQHVKEIGGTCLSLHAQCRVKEFYQKMGYHEFGEIEEDEGCPHIWMKKVLG